MWRTFLKVSWCLVKSFFPGAAALLKEEIKFFELRTHDCAGAQARLWRCSWETSGCWIWLVLTASWFGDHWVFFMCFALSLFACTSGKGFRCFLSSCFLPSTRPYCWFWEWHWWTVLPTLLAGGLSVMTCHEGREALKALKLLRSVKEKNQTIEENHREFSLSWRTSCLSEHNYFAGPFLPPLKTLSLI